MPSAVKQPIPSAALPQQPPKTTVLPSIEALGRRLAAVDKAHSRADALIKLELSFVDALARTAAMNLLQQQSGALRDLIVTLPAVTLADAAVQVRVAACFASTLRDCELPEHDATRLGGIVERVLLSVLPAIATAAGLDADAMGLDDSIALRAARFAGLENLA